MRKANCGLTPEGYPVIFITALAAIVFGLLECWLLAVLFLLMCWFSLHFFRDPERVTPQEEGLAVSPADGKVVCCETRMDPMTNKPMTCIGIFMNVFSVHVNRSPVDAKMEKIVYWPGKYFNASLDKASKYNERCGYTVRDMDGQSWSFVQIAGLIARRIVCRTEVGDHLARGERFGMIRFGSRVDLYIPDTYMPAVTVGTQVFAGQTVVATRRV